jgi:hypothetical protein
VGCRRDGERVEHPDLVRAGPQDEGVGVVQAPVRGGDVCRRQPELGGGLSGCAGAPVGDEGGVHVGANTQVVLVHPPSI